MKGEEIMSRERFAGEQRAVWALRWYFLDREYYQGRLRRAVAFRRFFLLARLGRHEWVELHYAGRLVLRARLP
jgi:hypothetical protein